MGQTLAQELRSGKYKKKVDVDLSKQQLAELPGSIGALKACRKLNISENDLIHLPEEIGKLTLLEVFLANKNRLTDLPEEIGNLAALKELYVQNNNLFRYPLTPAIGKLKLLEKLNLSGNQLDDLPAELAECTNLIELDLSDNNLKVIPREFGNLSKIQVISAQKNKIQALPATLGTSLTYDLACPPCPLCVCMCVCVSFLIGCLRVTHRRQMQSTRGTQPHCKRHHQAS
jgi:Leucine-rich repeat (LRR) protein